MAKFKPSMLVGMPPKLISLVQTGVQHYGSLRAAGMEVSPEIVAVYLDGHAATWNPEVQGKAVLDDDTKTAGCRFLGGLACNLGEILGAGA